MKLIIGLFKVNAFILLYVHLTTIYEISSNKAQSYQHIFCQILFQTDEPPSNSRSRHVIDGITKKSQKKRPQQMLGAF